MTSPQPVMIMVAPNGARGMKRDNAALPISPKEIADDVVRCAAAGSSIAHLHARNPDGSPTQSIEVFREIADRIRERCDIVLQISLGTIGFTVEQAIEPVALKPEMVSLPLDARWRCTSAIIACGRSCRSTTTTCSTARSGSFATARSSSRPASA
jgi:3-keto-5-aminohexanoate cleavage enzyme